MSATNAPSTYRTNLRAYSLPELHRLVVERGLPEYRYRQIARWLYDKAVDSIDEMTDLSIALREDLASEFDVGSLEVVSEQASQVDGTRKFLFRLADGGSVEAVLMPTEKRITLCISSQVGCTLDCVFCRTGRMGFYRNLEPAEILGQVLPLWRRIRHLRTRTNIVFMGMGEPLHNVPAVVAACRVLRDPLGLNLGPKRITVSTAGVVPGIRKLADSGLGIGLAVSVNATTQEARARLMPRAARTPLPELIAAARAYAERFGSRVTMEYVLMQGVNDSREDAERLGKMFRGGPFKINIIPYNPGADTGLERPDRERVDRFAQWVWPNAPVVTVRWSMGPDIAAACGQLRTEIETPSRKTPGEDLSGPAPGESSKPSEDD